MRPRWIPHLVAAGVTIPFAIWVATSDVRGVLHPAAWLLPLAGAYYLGLRIGREIVRGVLRARDDEASGRWMGSDDDEQSQQSVSAADAPPGGADRAADREEP